MRVVWKTEKGSILQECCSCLSVLEVSKKDMKKGEFHFSRWVFECPVCKTIVPLDDRGYWSDDK